MDQSTLLASAWVLLHPLIVLSVLFPFFKARWVERFHRIPPGCWVPPCWFT